MWGNTGAVRARSWPAERRIKSAHSIKIGSTGHQLRVDVTQHLPLSVPEEQRATFLSGSFHLIGAQGLTQKPSSLKELLSFPKDHAHSSSN